jgi:hypothetical protein
MASRAAVNASIDAGIAVCGLCGGNSPMATGVLAKIDLVL